MNKIGVFCIPDESSSSGGWFVGREHMRSWKQLLQRLLRITALVVNLAKETICNILPLIQKLVIFLSRTPLTIPTAYGPLNPCVENYFRAMYQSSKATISL